MPAGLDAPALQQLLQDMPLPPSLLRLLRQCTYIVPQDGMFSAASTPFGSVAFERPDLVRRLVNAVCDQPNAYVVPVYGLRRRGRTFSMPWAVVEAIRELEGAPRRPFIAIVNCLGGGCVGNTQAPCLLSPRLLELGALGPSL